MRTVYDVVNAVMEAYFHHYESGLFHDDTWDDESTFSVSLSLPFPADFSIKISAYSEYSGEDNHFVVDILDRNGKEIAGSTGAENGTDCEDLEYAVYRAVNAFCDTQWYDFHAEAAWAEFQKIPLDATGCIKEDFIKFEKGTFREEILDWFGKIYRHGIMPLLEPAGPGEQIQTFRIPLEWKCRGYLDVPAKDWNSALKLIEMGRFQLPKGLVVEDSIRHSPVSSET